MVKKLKPKSEFLRNVLTLMTGTIIAQAIPIAISPVLTRIYSPDEFGIFALYMAIVSIISVIATGRYEQAIMLPKDDSEAANIVTLAIIITLAISTLLLITVVILNQNISKVLDNPEISTWLYLTPFSVLIIGVHQSLNYWKIRKKNYKILAQNRVFQNITTSSTQVLGGIESLGVFSLIIGDIIGRIVALFFLIWMTLKNDYLIFTNTDSDSRLVLAKRYKKFPIFDTSASFANIGSYQIQNILFPIYYGLASAGHYFLVLRVMQAPLSLICSSLTDVYKQKLTSKHTTEKDLKIYYKKMFFFLLFVGLIPFTALFFFAELFFSIIFGNNWIEAGKYASILAPMFFIRFIASPLSYFLYLKEKQEMNVIGNLLLLISAFLSIYMSDSVTNSVILISISFSLVYFWYIYYSAKLAKVV